MKNLITAIMTAFTGAQNDFYDDIAGRMFLDEAPEGTEYPYCVFMVVSGVPERTFSEHFTDTLIQFSLFSSSASAAEIADMYADLKTLYDEKSFTITSNTLIWFREANLATMVDEVTTPSGTVSVKHWAVDFEVKTSLN